MKNIFVNNNTVIVEFIWKAALHIHIGSLAPDQTMTAYATMFIDFIEGKIVNQRNYDCFEPF